MEKNIQLYCDTDETGKIIRMLSGKRIIPVSTYKNFLMIDEKEQANLDKFRVIDGQLVQIEGTTLIEVENANPSTEEQLAELKKQVAEMDGVKEQLAAMQKMLELLMGASTPPTTEDPPIEEPTEPTNE